MDEKIEKFIDNYIQSFNIEKSAILAGYDRKEAFKIGVEILSSPNMQDYIKERTEKFETIAKNNKLTKDRLYLIMMLNFQKADQKGDVRAAMDILERMAKWNGLNPDELNIAPAVLNLNGVNLGNI